MCLLLLLTAGTFFGSTYLSPMEACYFLISAFFVFTQCTFVAKFFVFISALLFALIYYSCSLSSFYLFLSEIILLGICAYNLLKESVRYISFFILALAFLCHLFYIQSIPVEQYQHDLNGILLYMNKISLNGFNWRDFNPWYMYYLFHQPLHFWLLSYLQNFSLDLWNSLALSHELLQYISLFYVTVFSVIFSLILKELKFNTNFYFFALLLFIFNPTLFLFSGYISDDASVLFWGCLVVYFSFKWFLKNKTRYIVFSALCFGFGVLTKLSILMLVPALSFLFLYKLISARFNKSVWLDLNLFIIIAVPLALSWIVRNHVLFDMQFYNVPDTSPNGQNFYNLDFWERIFDFSQIFIPFIQSPVIVDGNIWLALIKTELFGEWDMSLRSPILFYPAFGLYLFNLLLKLFVLCSVLFLLYKMCRKQIPVSPFLIFFIILYLTLWGYGFKYAMDYPYACSSDFRLFALLMLPDTIIPAYTLQKISFFQQQKKANILLAFAIIYSILTCFIYTWGF